MHNLLKYIKARTDKPLNQKDMGHVHSVHGGNFVPGGADLYMGDLVQAERVIYAAHQLEHAHAHWPTVPEHYWRDLENALTPFKNERGVIPE